MNDLHQSALDRSTTATDLLPHARVIGIEEAVRLAEWWANRRLEDAAMVANNMGLDMYFNNRNSDCALAGYEICTAIRSLKSKE
jgi:hypothetical protein